MKCSQKLKFTPPDIFFISERLDCSENTHKRGHSQSSSHGPTNEVQVVAMSCALKLNVAPGFQKTTTIPWPLQVFQELSTSCQDHFLHSTDPTTLNKIFITFD